MSGPDGTRSGSETNYGDGVYVPFSGGGEETGLQLTGTLNNGETITDVFPVKDLRDARTRFVSEYGRVADWGDHEIVPLDDAETDTPDGPQWRKDG